MSRRRVLTIIVGVAFMVSSVNTAHAVEWSPGNIEVELAETNTIKTIPLIARVEGDFPNANLRFGYVGKANFGIVVKRPDSGSVVYFPMERFDTEDSFSYELCDGNDVCKKATVRLFLKGAQPKTPVVKSTAVKTPAVMSLDVKSPVTKKPPVTGLAVKKPVVRSRETKRQMERTPKRKVTPPNTWQRLGMTESKRKEAPRATAPAVKQIPKIPERTLEEMIQRARELEEELKKSRQGSEETFSPPEPVVEEVLKVKSLVRKKTPKDEAPRDAKSLKLSLEQNARALKEPRLGWDEEKRLWEERENLKKQLKALG